MQIIISFFIIMFIFTIGILYMLSPLIIMFYLKRVNEKLNTTNTIIEKIYEQKKED